MDRSSEPEVVDPAELPAAQVIDVAYVDAEGDVHDPGEPVPANVIDFEQVKAEHALADQEQLEQHRQEAIQEQSEQLKVPLLDRQIQLLRQALADIAAEHDCSEWLKEYIQRRLYRAVSSTAQIVVGLQGGAHETFSMTYQGNGQFAIKPDAPAS